MLDVGLIDKYLTKLYPDNKIELEYSTDYELAVAVILSAQCTDKRVNEVTKILFDRANTPKKMLKMGQEEIAKIIRPCGLNNSKAKSIISLSAELVEKYNGVLPDDYDKLIKVRGIGRKTANVLLSQLFGQNTFAVDTHVFRVCNRLGLANAKNVLDTEKQVKQKFKKERLGKLHIQLVMFGRYHCTARNPKCCECGLRDGCKYFESIKEKKCL